MKALVSLHKHFCLLVFQIGFYRDQQKAKMSRQHSIFPVFTYQFSIYSNHPVIEIISSDYIVLSCDPTTDKRL